MKIYFVRHGKTEFNKLGKTNGQRVDEPLVEEGLDQARETAKILPNSIEQIYCSDMLRARQTAEILNQTLNVPISFYPELRESDMGDLTGKTWQEMDDFTGLPMRADYGKQIYDFRPWGGESVAEVKTRVEKIIKQAKESGKETLIVAHGGIVRIAHVILTKEVLEVDGVGHVALHTFEI